VVVILEVKGMDLSRFNVVTKETAGFDVQELVPVSLETYKLMQKKLKMAGVVEKDVLFNWGGKLHAFVRLDPMTILKFKSVRKLLVYYVIIVHLKDCKLKKYEENWRLLFFSKDSFKEFKRDLEDSCNCCIFGVFKGYIVDPKSVVNPESCEYYGT
jgi:hypothetical protein